MKLRFKHLVFITIFALVSSVGIFYIVKAKNKRYLLTIPLKHLEYDDFFYLDIDVEGQTIPLLLDTGSDSLINLQKAVLEKVKNKKEIGFSNWYDAQGNNYKSPCYQVDLIRLDKIKFFNCKVKEKSKDIVLYSGIVSNPNASSPDKKQPNKSRLERIEKKVGSLGIWGLRFDDCWLLDFPHSKIYCMKVKKFNDALKDLQISLDDFIEVSLLKETPYFAICVDTSIGKKTFMIDSASDRTIMRCPSGEFIEYKTIIPNHFSIGGIDFGEQEIFLYNFTDKMEFDGILGLDFLNKRRILLDPQNNRVFISKKASSD